MKNAIFLTVAAFNSFCVFGQSQRLGLVEEFTQASCNPCASHNPALNALLSANTAKTASIKYQVSWPGADPMNAQNPSEVQARASVTGAYATGVPYAVNNGAPVTGGVWKGDPAALTQAKIDSVYAIPSPFTMVLSHSFNAAYDSIFITCKITCTQAINMSFPVVRLAMMEKTITFSSPPGSNGEKVFEHVMRKMYPDANGTMLATAWSKGTSQTLTFKEEIPSYIYDKNEIATIAWIQDDVANQEIYQVAYSPVSSWATGINDAEPVSAVSVYPNPANGNFTASFEAVQGDNYSVKITNTLGQIVYEEALSNFRGTYTKEINISSFGKGVYLLTVSDSENSIAQKVIAY